MRGVIARTVKMLRLVQIHLLAQKASSLILILCVAASYFAMQIVLAPSAAMTDEIRLSPMTDSYSIDFSENGVTEKSQQRLRDLFAGRMSVLGQYAVSGFYGSFSEDQPTILGVKKCGENAWYVQAEGRYFSEAEEESGSNVAIISRHDYEWKDFCIESHVIEVAGSSYQLVGLGEYSSPLQFFIGKQEVYQKLSYVPKLQELIDEAFTDHERHVDIEALQATKRRISQTVLIPYTNYEMQQMVPSVVCFMFSGLGCRQKAEMQQALSALFPEAIITAPPDAEQFMAATMKKETAVGLSLSCCCLLFLYALFAFWLDRNRKVLRSCRVAGGSEKTLRTLVCLSWFSILLVGYIASVGISVLFSGLFELLQMDVVHLHIGYHIVLFLIPVVITTGLMRANLTKRRWKEFLK